LIVVRKPENAETVEGRKTKWRKAGKAGLNGKMFLSVKTARK
jgi:hypothetical protein